MVIANMLVKLGVARIFGRATPACKGRQTSFFLLLCDAGFFGLLLFLEHTCLLVSLPLLLLLLFEHASLLGLPLLLYELQLFLHALNRFLDGFRNAITPSLTILIDMGFLGFLSLLSLLCMGIASSFDLQIPFATEGVISMNLIDALRSFRGDHIEHEATAETVA